MRVRSTSRRCGTAGSGNRVVTPARVAWSARVVPISGRLSGRLVCGLGASHSARWRLSCRRRRSQSRVARLSAGYTEAWGRLPPRRRTAIFWASIVSCVAWPPGLAFRSRAWPQTQGIPSWVQRSARQVPGEEALDADHQVFAVGGNRLQKRCGPCRHMAVPHDRTVLSQDAALHGAGVPVDPAVKRVWLGVESPEVSSSCAC
jgi:hypothetical protein